MMQVLHSQIFGEGTPFLILHGFLGMSDNWKTMGMQYAAQGFQLHLLDLRNHGHSFHSEDFSYEVMVQDVYAYMEYHGLESAIVLGHSMGGKVAMELAVTYSEKVKKLIVADIAPKYYPVHHQTILNGLASLDFSKIKTRGEADNQLANYISYAGSRMFLLKNLYWVAKGQLGLRLNLKVLTDKVGEVGESLAKFANYQGPTLFIKGERSEYVMREDEVLIKTHFPKVKIVAVSRAGHWLHAENPEEFFEKTISFIKD